MMARLKTLRPQFRSRIGILKTHLPSSDHARPMSRPSRRVGSFLPVPDHDIVRFDVFEKSDEVRGMKLAVRIRDGNIVPLRGPET